MTTYLNMSRHWRISSSLPVTAVLVETSKAGPTLNLPKVALLERLKDITTETFDELDKILPVDQPALEEPHDDDMVGQGYGVVVEL